MIKNLVHKISFVYHCTLPYLLKIFIFSMYFWHCLTTSGFPDSSFGKVFACNAGDPSSIPASRRSAGEGIGYPLQCWASLVPQLVKNLPAMWETWVQFLGWDDSLEKGKATHSSILAWRIPQTVYRVARSQTPLSSFHFHFHYCEVEIHKPTESSLFRHKIYE